MPLRAHNNWPRRHAQAVMICWAGRQQRLIGVYAPMDPGGLVASSSCQFSSSPYFASIGAVPLAQGSKTGLLVGAGYFIYFSPNTLLRVRMTRLSSIPSPVCPLYCRAPASTIVDSFSPFRSLLTIRGFWIARVVNA